MRRLAALLSRISPRRWRRLISVEDLHVGDRVRR